MAIHHHEGDLPAHVKFEGSVAVDTETMGLNPFRDALCVVQLSDGKGDAHVVRLQRPDYNCPNLKALVSNPRVLKIFHFARFDLRNLTEQQKHYAASDVLHLHEIKARLDMMLEREGRTELAQACFDFLPVRAALDLSGWSEQDIFAHS